MKQTLVHIAATTALCFLCSCAPRQEAIDRYYYMEMDPDERAYTDLITGLSPEEKLITETYREQVENFFDFSTETPLSEGMLLVDMLPVYYEIANSFYAFKDLIPPSHLQELHLEVVVTMAALGDIFVECAHTLEQNASEQPTGEEIVALIGPILEEMVSLDESAYDRMEKELGI